MKKLILPAVLAEKLERRVVVMASGCLEWQGSRNERGYGRLWDGERLPYVHRLQWRLKKLAFEAIPAGAEVMHECDNPRCINIDHLKLGTHAENQRAMQERGRARGGAVAGRPSPQRGSAHKRSKLTEEQARAIKRRLPAEKGEALASEFGVSSSLVYGIGQGKNWGWLE